MRRHPTLWNTHIEAILMFGSWIDLNAFVVVSEASAFPASASVCGFAVFEGVPCGVFFGLLAAIKAIAICEIVAKLSATWNKKSNQWSILWSSHVQYVIIRGSDKRVIYVLTNHHFPVPSFITKTSLITQVTPTHNKSCGVGVGIAPHKRKGKELKNVI